MTYYPASKGSWSADSDTPKAQRDLLTRIRKRYDYMVGAWKEIRDEAEKDQRALSTSGPWKDEERDERDRNGRPCVHLDQLTQYVSALVNQVRSEPIAIKVNPAGEGANDKTADLRARRIRAIEYESNAQSAYQTAFECAASMGFGAFGVTIEYKSWDSNQRVIKVRRFANPWAIMWDPDCKEADCADMQDAFVLQRILKDDFERYFPDATVTSFGESETKLVGSSWIDDDSVQVGEYWHLEPRRKRAFWVESPQGTQRFFEDELEGWNVRQGNLILRDGTAMRILEDRRVEEPVVRMVETNGIEILSSIEWPGKEIPVIPVIGREKYIRSGNKVKRMLESYIRMARDGQMMFDYTKSNMAEALGRVSKMTMLGYTGQFTAEYWDTIHKIPRGYAEVEPIVDAAPGQLLPLPQFVTYEPPIQALELAAESSRRSIQAAVASYGYTRLDDTNVKSGVALKKLDEQRDLGSYHLVDNYKNSIRRAGRIINDLLDDVESDARQVSLRDMDETQEVVPINQPGPNGQALQYRLTDEGQHEVTLSTGPNFQSQKEEGMQVFESLVSNFKNLPIDPAVGPKLLAEMIRGRQLGPTGDKLIEILNPEEQQQQIPPQVQAMMQKQQMENQALNAYAQQLEAQMADLQKKAEGKELDNQTKREIAALQADVDMFKAQLDAMTKGAQMRQQAQSQDRQIQAQQESETRKTAADLAKTHETLTSQENIEHGRQSLQAEQAEVDARIRATAEDNKVEIAGRQADIAEKVANKPTPQAKP